MEDSEGTCDLYSSSNIVKSTRIKVVMMDLLSKTLLWKIVVRRAS